MAREFLEPELAYGDQLFGRLKAMATLAGVETTGDGELTLGVGPTYNRTVGGNYAARAGFPEEGAADEEFLRSLADTPPDVERRGVYLARHASGLLIMQSGYRVSSANGDIRYDYHLRTLRTAEHPEQVIAARAKGQLALQASGALRDGEVVLETGGLLTVDHLYSEVQHRPEAFFTVGFNLTESERVFRDVVGANAQH
jgi:hypothetical protein